jgi:hypothetical protein
MRCKVGDLAVVLPVNNAVQYAGRIVRCVAHRNSFGHICWITSPKLDGDKLVWDGALYPIRDQDGDDETITWAGKPEGVTA